MERLTFEGNFCDIAKCTSLFCESGMCSQRKVWERLKYYEDMEEQGRLVVLPCKVGDTLYRISLMCDASLDDDTRCDEFSECAGCPYLEKEIVSWECKSTLYIYHNLDKFGKTVFLTREDAERALKEGADQ